MKSVAIVGGGITGLTAAFRLKEMGISVTLYEATDRVGGVIQSIRKDGFMAEFGPNTILETSPLITQLVKDAGLAGRRVETDPRAGERYLVRGKRPVALPDSPLAFFGTRLFSTGTKLRLFAEPFIRRAPADVEESLSQFVLRRLGREFLDYAINPMVAGVYAGNPDMLSVRHAFPKLWALEQRYGSMILGQFLGARERKRRGTVSKDKAPKFSFDNGLRVLVETLQERLGTGVQLSSPVRRLTRKNDRWTVASTTGGAETQAEFDAVILTSPAHKLAELEIQTDRRIDVSPLGEISYPPVASIVLGYRRQDVSHPCMGFGMLIPQVEKCNSLGVIFSSALFPNRAPEGHITLTCYIGGARAPQLVCLDADKLVELAHQDIATILGATQPPVFKHLTKFNKAIPQYNVGYGRFKSLMSDAEGMAPGLFFAGHYRDGISLGDSMVSGHEIANRVQLTFRSAPSEEPPAMSHLHKRGVLLVNLGSPDSTSVSDVRRYLREFLMDGRVLDAPYPIRFFVVHCLILPRRPRQSAEAYEKIWTPQGSPLVATSKNVRGQLAGRFDFPIELAMRYQNPSIPRALENLRRQGVNQLLVIPLFPQYAMSSHETAVERVKELAPDMQLSFQRPFYDHPKYLEALVASATPALQGGFDHLLFSYHGIPERHVRKADPTRCHCLQSKECCATPSPAHATCYRAQCFKTTAAFVERAGIPAGKYSISFQSRLGRDPWLAPYTDFELIRLAKGGVKKLLVICPAFVSDCLETIEEIGLRGRESFIASGGTDLARIPCLNEHPLWLNALEGMIKDAQS